METDLAFTGGFEPSVVRQFRIRMQTIRTVSRRMQLYQFGGLRLEKLQGKRQHQHSMRLNRKWRLIVEFIDGKPDEKIVIVGIENHYER